jgi:hypothetical protein
MCFCRSVFAASRGFCHQYMILIIIGDISTRVNISDSRWQPQEAVRTPCEIKDKLAQCVRAWPALLKCAAQGPNAEQAGGRSTMVAPRGGDPSAANVFAAWPALAVPSADAREMPRAASYRPGPSCREWGPDAARFRGARRVVHPAWAAAGHQDGGCALSLQGDAQ